jgi:GMP synthase (glutamine-hydrolysing)
MKPIVIVKAGATFPWMARALNDFEHWTAREMGLSMAEVRVISVVQGERLPEPGGVGAVVVTGSHSMVTDRETWSERLAVWIEKVVENQVPFLGICYGHQLLAHATGGRVGYLLRGREIGTVTVRLTPAGREDPLLGGLPAEFPAHSSHKQTVLGLPRGATLLAEGEEEPHHSFRIGATAWGVQFHPEFDTRVMLAYISAQEEELLREGCDLPALRAGVVDTSDASSLPRRFVALARGVGSSEGVQVLAGITQP